MPFGYGKRQCPGMKFAERNIEALAQVLVSYYKIYLPPNSPHKDYLKQTFEMVPKAPYLELVFRRVDDDSDLDRPIPMQQLPFTYNWNKSKILTVLLVLLLSFVLLGKLSALSN